MYKRQLHDQASFSIDYDPFFSFEFDATSVDGTRPLSNPAAVASDVDSREFSADDSSGGSSGEDSAASAVRPTSLHLGLRPH